MSRYKFVWKQSLLLEDDESVEWNPIDVAAMEAAAQATADLNRNQGISPSARQKNGTFGACNGMYAEPSTSDG
jgi:hypothetical protein